MAALSMEEVVMQMTYNEMERVEKMAGGIPFGELFADFSKVSARSLRALGFVWTQRSEPELTVEEFGNRPALGSWSEFAGAQEAPQDAVNPD